MSRKDDYIAKTKELIIPILEENNFELYDIEYVKEGSDYYLRAYIDKEEGINIDDCVLVSRAMNEKLDALDFISDPYIFEVSSPGLLRPFKIDKDYERALGEEVEVRCYAPVDGYKEFEGILSEYTDNSVVLKIDDEVISLDRDNISLIRRVIEF